MKAILQAVAILILLVIANRCHPEVEMNGSRIPTEVKGGHHDQIR